MAELITLAQELWNGDLHIAFQNKGYQLAAWCQRGGAVDGMRMYFPKLAAEAGDGQAQNAVGAMLTFEPGDHSQVFIDMVDRFAKPLALRPLDLKKVVSNTDYRVAYAQNQLNQLGRYADTQVMNAFLAGKNATTLGPASGTALNLGHFDALREAFDLAEVPDDGQRVVFVHPKTWSQLIKFREFSTQEWIGSEDLPYKGHGLQGKRWQTFQWITYSRTPTGGSGNRMARNMVWHPSCMAHGTNSAPETLMTPETLLGGQIAVVTKQSMGAGVIDNTAVYEFQVDTQTPPST